MAFKEEIFEAAKQYAALGWKVFPCHTVDMKGKCSCGKEECSDAGKHPVNRRGLKEASSELAKIEEWFGELAAPRNIGLRTGEESSLTVIDIDTADSKGGGESWAAIVAEHGEPQTLMAITGSGGSHLLFKYNSALKTSGNVFGKGVDVRNDGGYIIVAPSRHRSGGVYEWDNWEGFSASSDAAAHTEFQRPLLADLPRHLTKRKETRGRPKKNDMFRGKYAVEQIASMLKFVKADDRDLWRSVGIILGREFHRTDEAWKLYADWSATWGGTQGRNHDEIMRQAFYELSAESVGESGLTLGTIVKAAIEGGWAPQKGEVPIGHFVYFGPGNNYIYRPTISFWIAPAVDAACSPVNEGGSIMRASDWLRENQLVTSMTSTPELEEDYIKGHDCHNGEIVASVGGAMFNSYRHPTIELGDARLAGPFVEHVRKVFNKAGDADQFLNYMAHRVQRPWEKPRFALLLAGDQGVGKDTAVEFCVPAIGSWNVANISPAALDSGFNEYEAATLVRINESANLHEMTKWAFNEQTKVLIGGTPDVSTVNPKYGQKYTVKKFCGVIITTNHLDGGIYIPDGDRRYDVIAAATLAEMGLRDEEVKRNYFAELWDWFLEGGDGHVAAYLHSRDIKGWSPSNGQRKTAAHRTTVVAGMAGDSWLMDVLEELEKTLGEGFSCFRVDWALNLAAASGEMKLSEARTKFGYAIKRLNFIPHTNEDSHDGRWRIGGKKVVIYKRIGTEKVDLGMLEKELF